MVNKKEKTIKKKATKPKRSLTEEDVENMIDEWENQTIEELAEKLGVKYQTVLSMAKVINKEDASLCPPKARKRRRRVDVARAGIALYKKKQGTKQSKK